MRNIVKKYGDGYPAVNDVSLDIADGEFMILVGPSGCGKSTLLRMIVGLEDITSGDMLIGDQRVNDKAPRDRNLAMVFQNYALYPHLTVFENIAFPLRLSGKLSDEEIRQRVNDAAKTLELGEHLDRKPANLSGGQRQRVAMGRAIVREADAFLFDEPLSNLDAKLRGQMRTEIAQLQRRLGITSLYVTHDQTEAMTMGDRVAVMRDGVLQQVDSPLALYDTPKNLFVAGFIGSPAMNLMEGDVVDGGVKLGDYIIPVSRDVLAKVPNETKLTLGIRPEAFTLASEGIGLDVAVVEELGADAYLYGSLVGSGKQASIEDGEAHQVVARISSRRPPQRGEQVRLGVDPASVHVFSQETTERIS